jgi:hypothetical protein
VAARRDDDDGIGDDLLVATSSSVEASAIGRALADPLGNVSARTVLARAPLFWTRIKMGRGRRRNEVEALLVRSGIPVRYVASSCRQTVRVAPPLDLGVCAPARAAEWSIAPPPGPCVDPPSAGRWFLRDEPGGLAVDRAVCGTGHGTRLAVVDDDAADLELVDLDEKVLVGIDRAPLASGHAALLVGWAAGARTHEGTTFSGIAPGASVRAYLIPRPGDDVVALAVAIARAAADGADVILCAAYIEGLSSPMLDDALTFAARLGRGGLGCMVVLPTGREASSPPGSLHASLSLSLADPASDPRVFCVAPGGRRGGWFLWREQHGRLRPFANRGPAVSCLAPGDDLAYPFFSAERLFHAESSGASALAAGVALLVIASNPTLQATEVAFLLTKTATSPEPLPDATLADFVDPADTLPHERDLDGHDAKHGYGRLHARRACLAASDPVALELLSIGEEGAARGWADARERMSWVAGAYTRSMGWWAVRALLADPGLQHRLRVVLRHMRLVAGDPHRAQAHPPGAVIRQLALLLRGCDARTAPSTEVRREIDVLSHAACDRTSRPGTLEDDLLTLARDIFVVRQEGAQEGAAERQ